MVSKAFGQHGANRSMVAHAPEIVGLSKVRNTAAGLPRPSQSWDVIRHSQLARAKTRAGVGEAKFSCATVELNEWLVAEVGLGVDGLDGLQR